MNIYDQNQAEAFEAINAALHSSSYDFLGETEEGVEAWWHRGVYPRDVRVRVLRSKLAPFIEMMVTFRNVEGRTATIMQSVDCRGPRAKVVEATTQAMVRQLEIFRDVLDATGVAGPERNAGKIVSTADSNAPETEDEAREAGL